MRISDWSSDVCSSDLLAVLVEVKAPLPRLHQLQRCALGQDELGARRNPERPGELVRIVAIEKQEVAAQRHAVERVHPGPAGMDELALGAPRSEEHTSELQ